MPWSSSPRLVFGQKFAPDDGEFLKLAAEACIACNATSVTELALLLGLAFPGRNPGETRVFDCNKRGPRGDTALLLACRAGLLVLATMLMDAGADVSVANEQGDTALLLACKAGNLELATRLMDAGANVSVANQQGDTPLLAAMAIGKLVCRAARELGRRVCRAARELGRRRQGASAGWRRTHSASHPLEAHRLYQLCPAPRPRAHRVAEHFRCPRMGAGVRVSAQHPEMASRWCVPRTLALEIGALLPHPEADAGRLDDMRALLHRHKELIQDTAKWPVPHVVEQLAAQDLGASVQHDETDGSGAGMCRLIECITPCHG
jgi:hypothetical protein